MVANGHGRIAHVVHHPGGQFPLIIGIIQSTLKLVTAINQNRIAGSGAGFVNGRDQTGLATKALTFRIVLRAASTVTF